MSFFIVTSKGRVSISFIRHVERPSLVRGDAHSVSGRTTDSAGGHAQWTFALPRWKTGGVAAPEQSLEALVRDELRGPVSEMVRRLVPELAAEALNGHAPAAEVVIPGAEPPPEPMTAAAASDSAPASTDPATKVCKLCGETKPSTAFDRCRHQCRRCRNRRFPRPKRGPGSPVQGKKS
jgi:hypothetical protein